MNILLRNYLKTRILNLSIDIPGLMIQMPKMGIKNFTKTDDFEDPMLYEHALFVSSLYKWVPQNWDNLSPAESEQIRIGTKRLDEFTELRTFMKRCYRVFESVEVLRKKIMHSVMASNFVTTNEVE